MALTAKAKRALGGVVLIAVAFFGLRYAAGHGYGRKFLPAFMLPKINLQNDASATSLTGTATEMAPLPSSTIAELPGATEIRVNFWAWNAQMGCLYANGGPVTTENSLMAKQGVKVTIDRQDDNNQLMAQLTVLAKDIHDGNLNSSKGVQFVGIMGDGSAAFLSALNSQLVGSFGPEYRAEIVGSCGYSRGEDKLMGPASWKSNPQSLRGAVIAGVVRDGDWNIAMRYMGDNNIPNNPDETTYDPNTVNWINTSSYTDAAEKYVQGYSEKRRVVLNGKPTGRDTTVTVQGVVTWTPGDVTVAEKKGGLVTVVSTKEYGNQMPQVIIGIHKWNQTHRDAVVKMLTAFTQGGDQVLSFPQVLDKASEISQEINKEDGAGPEYWKKYYLGVREPDKLGNVVDLGGSKANNLADNLKLFGLSGGASPETSPFHATYSVFGKLVSDMYPNLLPHIAPMDSIFDPSYLRAVAQATGNTGGKAEEVTYNSTDTISRVVGRRAVHIEFATGSASLTPAGQAQLNKLFDELSINTLLVQVNGHTDNTGNVNANQQLSEERALAVKSYLEQRAPTVFPEGRVKARGFGSSEPVASNSTNVGRAANRRVEIIIGN